MTAVLGCDPGIHGALAVLDSKTGQFNVYDIPVHTLRTTTGKTRSELDLASLVYWITDIAVQIDHVFIEKVATRPGEGSVSSFRFGFATGAVHGICSALALPVTQVAPQAWQKTQGVASGPDAARQRVSQLYPDSANLVARKKDQHRADAILIARHGLSMYNLAQRVLAADAVMAH